jgi:hypothetical protein
MRREQRQRHVVLYVAPGNRMRCRFNRDSVHDTPHEQPPLHTPSTCFFRTTLHVRKDLCRPASEFPPRRHALFTCGALCKTRQKTRAVYFAKCFT